MNTPAMKKKRLLAAAIFFILVVTALFMLYRLGYDARSTPRVAQINRGDDSDIDLRDFDFAKQIATARFRQAGQYYHEKLLAPQEIDAHAPDDKSLIREADLRTYRLRFLVPDDEYMIFGKAPEYAARIYVNGSPAVFIGEIHEDPADNRYQIATYEIVARPVDGVIEVVTNSANIIRPDAEIYNINIGRHDVTVSLYLAVWVMNLIILGLVFACVMLFMGFYIFTPHSRANLYCALIAMSLGIRMAVAYKIVTKVVGELDYRLTYFIENGTLLIIVVFYVLLIRALFPESIPKLLVKIVITLNALLMAALICLPMYVTAGFIWLHSAMISAVALASIVCIMRHIRHFREEQIISFCGQLLFIGIGLLELLHIQAVFVIPRSWIYSLTVTDALRVATFGLLLFIITQMLALFLYNQRIVENEQRLAMENAELEKQNKWKAKRLGDMSHELKTPLTAISNVAQLSRIYTHEEYVKEKLDIVIAEVDRMKLGVGRILDLSRLEDDDEHWHIEAIDLEGLIRETTSHYFQALNEHNNKLSIDCPVALPAVKADAAQIAKVLVNLIQNAMRFTHDGQISVRTACDEGADSVMVTVEDTGSGIGPEQIGRIFDRFYTGDQSTGTGLGLFICKKIIENHGGRISVRSEPGSGTAVSFTLPLWKE